MKKLLLFPLFTIALALAFSACSDDEDESFVSDGHPEVTAQGTYQGVWTRVYSGDTVTANGYITVTATDTAYCADITFYCADFDLSATAVSNITYANSNTAFYYGNGSTDNGLGTQFGGMISNGAATVLFTKSTTVGRKEYEYTYSFNSK